MGKRLSGVGKGKRNSCHKLLGEDPQGIHIVQREVSFNQAIFNTRGGRHLFGEKLDRPLPIIVGKDPSVENVKMKFHFKTAFKTIYVSINKIIAIGTKIICTYT
jgi:hypothetical protein